MTTRRQPSRYLRRFFGSSRISCIIPSKLFNKSSTRWNSRPTVDWILKHLHSGWIGLIPANSVQVWKGLKNCPNLFRIYSFFKLMTFAHSRCISSRMQIEWIWKIERTLRMRSKWSQNIAHPLRIQCDCGCIIARMMTSSNGTFSALCAGNSQVPDEVPSQRPVTRSFDVFIDLRLNKRLSRQSRGRWFETPSHKLWRHCNECH